MTQDLYPFVAIIILTWNQRDLTLDCLESLAEMDYPSDRLQIIVVDNGSRDDTVVAIRDLFPYITVLENGDNLGFAEGNNVGIRYALQGPAEYIMLLNNDTVVDAQMLSILLQTAQQDTRIGVVTPKIYYYDDPKRIWCAGASIDWRSGGSIRRQAEQIDSNIDDVLQDVDFASGCAMCWRRQAIVQIGLLDPRFFIYYEETDWCVRVQRAGWRIVYQPQAHLWHRISAAMGTASPATDYYMTRNLVLFLGKHLHGVPRAASLFRVAVRNLLAIAAYSVKSHHGVRRPNRNARTLALRDAVLGRWGKMGDDVAAVCYPIYRENKPS
ncbi:MAG: glycosyltransferase family 2 protein [Nitrosomonas ureae]